MQQQITRAPKSSTLAYSLLEQRIIELRDEAIASADYRSVGELEELLTLLRNFAALIASERRAEA